MLEVRNLSKSFGGLKAVTDASLDVPEGSIVGLLGPNGAGKTTCFTMIAGFTKADEGTVRFQGKDITGLAPHSICALGMIRTFQIVQPFAGLTVQENIAVGAYLHHHDRCGVPCYPGIIGVIPTPDGRLGPHPRAERGAAGDR